MMFRSRRGAWALATLTKSLIGCTNEVDGAAASAKDEQAAVEVPGDMVTPTATGSASTVGAAVSNASDASGSTTVAESGMPTTAAGEAPVELTDDGLDPTGVWWTEVMTVGSEVLPILDKLDGTNIRFVMRVEVSGEAPNNTAKFQFCQLQTEWIDPLDPNNITTIGFRPKTVAAFSETITSDFGGLQPGSKVPLPSLAFRGGIDEAGKEFDEDGDGNPAVTAWVRTLLGVEIEVYETITINATLDLTVPDEDTLMGTVDFSADADIVSSNNVIIAAGTRVTITPDSKAVPVVAKRLPEGGDCATLPSTITFTTVPPPPPVIIPPPDPAP